MSAHLSDEQLSSLVDAAGGPDAEEHVTGCSSCRARLDALRAVVARLGEPVPVSEDRREQAVAAAMSTVTAPAAPGGTRPAVWRRPGLRPAIWRRPGLRPAVWRRPGALAGLAAAALIVAGVAVGISHAGGSNTSHSSASRSASAAPKATPVNGAPQGLGAVPQAPMVTASLGSIQSPQALAAAVRGVLGTGTAAGGIGAGVASGSGASGATPASAAAGCSVAPSRFPPGSQPVLLLQTAAVYRSVPAQVFAYRVGTGRVAFVLADHNCALLAQVPL